MPIKLQELGGLLVRSGMITGDQLEVALGEQKRTHERLGEILCRLGFLGEIDILRALGYQLGLRLFDPARDEVDTAALETVPRETARRHNLIPVRVTERTITVAMADPSDVLALDNLKSLTRRDVEVLLATAGILEELRERHYARIEGNRSVEQALAEAVVELGRDGFVEEDLDEEEAKRRAQDAPIITLVEQIVTQAIQERATDIHVEPQERGLIIRYRVDGLLYDALTPTRAVYTGVVSRIKILSDMDIAERRAAQDGRFSFRSEGQEVDVRVSAIPTIHGEKLVLRLLSKSAFNFSLRDLGFSKENNERFLRAIHQPYGMILLSGPTGSGKTTTLYAGLLDLRSDTLNITTVEDPVEYQVSRVNQVQVNEKKRVTFANALRSFLRQDPDVIMVGEVRDKDTAEMAVRAALTGHMVLSTIHANDAPSTAVRLVSMGVEPFQAASALTLVAAQRLVRRNCSSCLGEYDPPAEVLLGMGLEGADFNSVAGKKFRRGRGCAQCRGRGYLGRVAIIEMMPMTPDLRLLVAESRPADVIRRAAVADGMMTLRQSGLATALEGLTTPEEVLRVCLSDD